MAMEVRMMGESPTTSEANVWSLFIMDPEKQAGKF